MKRFLAMALAVIMLAAMMPSAFAAKAEDEKSFDREANKVEAPFSQKAVDNDGNVVDIKDQSTGRTVTADDVNSKYATIKASDFETKGWMAESPRSGLEMIDQEDSLLSGYWLTKDRFAQVNDWFTDGSSVYSQVIQPIDESGAYHEYMQGETFWMNYDLMKTWDQGSQSLIALDKKVNVYYYVYAGTIDDFSGEGGEGIRMVYGWQTGDSSMGMKITAPEDNYVYMFVVIVKDTTLNEFGGWVTPCYADQENEFKSIPSGSEMTVGSTVTTDTVRSQLVLIPTGTQYRLTYGEKHAIKLEGGKRYVAQFDSPNSIGFYAFFCDENMDVINYTFMGPGALSQGHTYSEYRLAVMPAITGTYYLVTCGFYMGDSGELQATIYNWDDVATPITNTDSTINLNELGTSNVFGPQTGNANFPYAWGYIWYADYSLGELLILYPGTYTITGSNENIFCDIYDGVNVVLNNATIGSIWTVNSYAPVTIKSVGRSSISNSNMEYAYYNYEGYNAGTYFLGENLTVTSSNKTQGGIYTDAAPMHVLTKHLEVYATANSGTYPVSIWTTGKNDPQLTFGNAAKFDGENQKAIMYYDGDSNNVFGYTVSKYPELYRVNNEPKYTEAALEFVLDTDGTNPDPGNTPTPTQKYTVTFIDGIDNSIISKVQVDKGGNATPPTPPTHLGYTFKEWQGSYTNVTANTTVTAIYDANTYKLTYYVDDTLYEEQTHTYGDVITPLAEPAPREGYIFSGWNYVPQTMPASDVRVDGRFISDTAKTYKVTFMDGFDNSVITVVTVEEGMAAVAPVTPEHEGYVFTGWDKDFSNITSDLTVTALYAVNSYTVTFKDYDGTVLDTQTVEYGKSAIAPADPVRVGYIFTGWDVDFTYVTRDLIVTAQYVQEGSYQLGDVNMDGSINTGDAVMILKHAASIITLSQSQLMLADVNRDDNINTGDAVVLLKYAAGMITEF